MKYKIIERKSGTSFFESNSLIATVIEFFSARKIVANLSIKKLGK